TAQRLDLEHEIHHKGSKLCILDFELLNCSLIATFGDLSIRSAFWLPSTLTGHLQAQHIFFLFDREFSFMINPNRTKRASAASSSASIALLLSSRGQPWRWKLLLCSRSHLPVPRPGKSRPRWPKQTSPYAFSITSFQLTGFAIVVITNASDTECIFWTTPAATFWGLVHLRQRFVCRSHGPLRPNRTKLSF